MTRRPRETVVYCVIVGIGEIDLAWYDPFCAGASKLKLRGTSAVAASDPAPTQI
jgi:hypothetical protein